MFLCVQDKCHPQTIAVCQSRAEGLGLEAVVASEDSFEITSEVSGVLVQYPATDGSISDYSVSPSSHTILQDTPAQVVQVCNCFVDIQFAGKNQPSVLTQDSHQSLT